MILDVHRVSDTPRQWAKWVSERLVENNPVEMRIDYLSGVVLDQEFAWFYERGVNLLYGLDGMIDGIISQKVSCLELELPDGSFMKLPPASDFNAVRLSHWLESFEQDLKRKIGEVDSFKVMSLPGELIEAIASHFELCDVSELTESENWRAVILNEGQRFDIPLPDEKPYDVQLFSRRQWSERLSTI